MIASASVTPRILLAQLAPTPGRPDLNADQVCAALAAHPRADLACFPELYLTGYAPLRAGQDALGRDSLELGRIASAAAQHGTSVVVGFAERLASKQPRGQEPAGNSVACFDATGELRGIYRKTHLFGNAERTAFTAGDELLLVTLSGLAVGPLICFDMEFPEPARSLCLAGAELLVTLAANMVPYGPEHALAARARALDNRCPHVYVNRIGDESGCSFAGGSCVIAPDGEVWLQLGEEEAIVEFELPGAPDRNADLDYLRHRRPALRVRDAR
jgi:predicted amidohydrolase